jgi:hypothetical protein
MFRLSTCPFLLWLFFILTGLSATFGDEATRTDPPHFSHASGFYQEAFYLTLTSEEPGTVIYYTLDGSEPDPEGTAGTTYRYKNSWPQNPWSTPGLLLTGAYHTHVYADPIQIRDRSAEPDSLTRKSSAFSTNYYFPSTPVFKGTVVRAMAVKEGMEQSHAVTQVYFIHPEARSRFHFPVVTIATNEDHLFDYDNGVYTPGVDFDSWRQQNPGEQVNGGRPANYHRRGEEWEYPAHLTYFDTYSTVPDLSQDIGIRVHGGWTRSYPMKSLRLYARNAYGTSSLDYPFFEGYPYDSFKRLVLRNSGNDWAFTMFRDAVIQEVISPLRFETQACQPSILFLNGEFWGIHNIRERYDKHYLARVYGVDEDGIDLLTRDGEIREGGRVHYVNTLNYIRDHDMASDIHFEHIGTRIDLENFMDYQIANIYVVNTDWPANNIDFWRKQTFAYEPDSPYGHDGRWRWLAYDLDFGFGLIGSHAHNTLEFATATGNDGWPNPDWSTFLLRSLLENIQFRNDFINRFADLLNTRFHPDTVTAIIDGYGKQLEPEIPAHIHRWKQPGSVGSWKQNVQMMKNFANSRPSWQRQHIRQFFGLEGQGLITVNVSDPGHGYVKVNTIEIRFQPQLESGRSYPWTGTYFTGIPIRLEAVPAEGFAFSHWEGVENGDSAVVTGDLSRFNHVTAHFVPVETETLIHFWYFDTSIPNDQPLEYLDPSHSLADGAVLSFRSALEGYPFEEGNPWWRKASMERRNVPTPVNYKPAGNNMQEYNAGAMRGIQVKQPFRGDGGENALVFRLPATGFRDVVFRFAAMNEGAADALLVEYATGEMSGLSEETKGEEIWIPFEFPDVLFLLSDEFRLFEADFTGIEAVNDNPDFSIRIRFTGSDMESDEGNRVSFNNFSLEGWALEQQGTPPQVICNPGLIEVIEMGEEAVIDLNDIFSIPGETPLSFAAESTSADHVAITLEENLLTLAPLFRGDAAIMLAASDGNHDPVEISFRVLVYPAAFTFDEGDFYFGSWSAGEAEFSYPEHMLFLQSDMTDPEVDSPLLYPYHVPHDDYHGDDLDRLGFPYSLGRRTRINALGDQGISFINTGRDRDLGGALLAIRTTGMSNLQMEWLGATILLNSRNYALRLQYRPGHTGDFEDLLMNGEPMVYVGGQDGESRRFGPWSLPGHLLDQEYVQLLWRYHHVSGDSGPRSELRLDDITIGPWVGLEEHSIPEALIYASGSSIALDMKETGQGAVSVFDLQGRLLLAEQLPGYGVFYLNRSFRPGLYIVRLETPQGLFRQKVIVN